MKVYITYAYENFFWDLKLDPLYPSKVVDVPKDKVKVWKITEKNYQQMKREVEELWYKNV